MAAQTHHELARHAACIRALAAALLREARVDDDVAQEAALLAWQRGLAARPGWLRVVWRRLAARSRRDAARRRRRERAAARAEAVPPAAELAARAELLQRIAAAVAGLSPHAREVVLLRFYEELPPRKIAARLGLSVAAVHSRLRRALDELRADLQQRLGARDLRALGALVDIRGPAAASKVLWLMSVHAKLTLSLAAAAAAAACLLLARQAPWSGAPAGPAATPSVASPRDAASEVGSPRAGAGPAPARTDVAAAPPAAATARVQIRGKVVDERRHPVEGAAIHWHDALGGATATSGANGAFALPIARRQSELDGLLGATAGTLTTLQPVTGGRWSGEVCDVGVLTLREAAALTVTVVAAGRPVCGAQVVARASVAPGADWQETMPTDAAGEALFAGLGAARYVVRVAQAEAAASAIVDLATGAREELRLELTSGLALRVEVHDGAASAAGAHLIVHERAPGEAGGVHVLPFAETEADEHGRATVRGLRPGQVLSITAAADGRRGTATRVRIARDMPPVRIELRGAGGDVVRWHVAPGEVAAPPDGTALALRLAPGGRGAVPGHAAMQDRAVVVAGAVHAGDRFLASAPCGALALLAVPADGADGTATFRLPRRLRVEVSDQRGAPLPGWPICLCDPGGSWREGPWLTDAAGSIDIGGWPGGQVCAVLDAQPWSQTPGELVLGTADLDAGDAVLRVQRVAPRRIAVQVFVDGEPRLPPELALHAERGHCAAVREDPERGALTCELWPHEAGSADRLLLYGPFDHSIGVADVPAGTGDAQLEVTLERHAAAAVDLRPPLEGTVGLRLELELAPGGGWAIRSHVPDFAVPAAVPLRFSNLRPGRYRLRDDASGVVGPEVVLMPGCRLARLEIDLSRVVTVAGRVVAPAGSVPRGACVEVFDRSTGATLRSVGCDATGAFSLRVSVDSPDLRLRARAEGLASEALPLGGPADALLLAMRPR